MTKRISGHQVNGNMIKQLAHVGIFARDLQATEAFWTGVLGLRKAFSFTRGGRAIGFCLDAGGRSNIEVFEKPGTSYSEDDQINHICLEVHSIDAAIGAIRAKGVAITDKKLAVDNSWQAWTFDPNGVKIELFEYTANSAQFVGGDRVVDW